MVMEGLNGIIERVKELNLLKGVRVGKRDNFTEISHLFFADDTLIFCQPDLKNLLYLKYVLYWFQVVSGLKINLIKSELARIGGNGDVVSFARILRCKEIKFPFKYLGVPLGAKYKDQGTWEPIIDLFESRLAGWKRNFLPEGGRFTLIKHTLANLPIYYLSTLTILVKVAKKLEAIQCRFLWGDTDESRKFHFVN